MEEGERLIVGVNAFKSPTDAPINLLQDRREGRRGTDSAPAPGQGAPAIRPPWPTALARVEAACRDEKLNLMPPVIEAVKAYATLGEVSDVFRKVWGQYREGGIF